MKKTYWLKNTKGEPSASLTLIVVAFTLIMLHMALSIFVKPFGLDINPFDAGEAMMILTPLLGLYWGRRNTDVKETEIQLKHNGKNGKKAKSEEPTDESD
jgi:hypothetical protein